MSNQMTQLNSLAIMRDIEENLEKDIETAVNFVSTAILNNISSVPSPRKISESEAFWMKKLGKEECFAPLTHSSAIQDNQTIINEAAKRMFYAFD
jgi:hypothetical protein